MRACGIQENMVHLLVKQYANRRCSYYLNGKKLLHADDPAVGGHSLYKHYRGFFSGVRKQ